MSDDNILLKKIKKIKSDNYVQIEKYQKEYYLNAQLRDKTYLTFSMLGATIIGWVINTTTIPPKYKLIVYLIICYLIIISSLALLSICLCTKVTETYIENYIEVNNILDKIENPIKNDNIIIKNLEPLNLIIENNRYSIFADFIDKIIFSMILSMVVLLFLLFIYLFFSIWVKSINENIPSIYLIMLIISIHILSLKLILMKNSGGKYEGK